MLFFVFLNSQFSIGFRGKPHISLILNLAGSAVYSTLYKGARLEEAGSVDVELNVPSSTPAAFCTAARQARETRR